MTQRERVYHALRQAGTRGVTTNEFLADHLPRFGARIEELRQRGWHIETKKEGKQYRYTLHGYEQAPAPTRQLTDRQCLDKIEAMFRRSSPGGWRPALLDDIADLIEKTDRNPYDYKSDAVRPDGPETKQGGLLGQEPY